MKVLLVFLLLVVAAVHACDTAVDEPNVCLYGNANLDGNGDDVDRTRCQTVNNNPFALVAAAGSGSPSAAQCRAYAEEDGSDCVAFYASYVCSSFCSLCNKLPCQNFCSNYQSKCPTAAAAFCFKSIACVDGTAGVTCTRWNADTSQIPASSATTRASTSTTTRLTTTRTTTEGNNTDDFSSGYALRASIFLLVAVLGLNQI